MQKLDDWQRIERIVDWTGLSVNAFARGIGLKRAENLYQIKKGNHGISRELAASICARYPLVNMAWLLTGQGAAFNQNVAPPANIPFFRREAVVLLSRGSLPEPDAILSLPILEGCELSALHLSRAMEPDIPEGAAVMLRRVGVELIASGSVYLILCGALSGIWTVRRLAGASTLSLVPRNLAEFARADVDISQVEGAWEVMGHLVIA